MEIILPIFYHSNETRQLKDIDIEYKLSDCLIRQVTFYNIVAISPYFEDDNEYTSIHTNATEYISPLKITEVKSKING